MNVSAWSIRNPIAAVMLFVLLTLAGAMSFKAMKIQNFPDLELPTVTVTASLPGAAPAQMETEVARKIENAVATLQGVKHIYGKVQDGTATITVEFRLEKPTQEAVDDVRDAVSRVRADLPADMRDPQVSKMNLSGAPILTYTIEAPRMDAEALSWFVDNDITKALLSINGVGSVARVGGVTREVQVNIDPARLLALGATVADVSRQLRAVQQDASGGRTDWAGGEQTVRTIATVQSAAELAQLDIPLQGGRRAKLADLATVADTVAEQRSVALLDGKPVVGFEITRSRGASEVEVDAGVSRVLAELKTAHSGVVITQAFNMVDPVIENYDGSLTLLYEGACPGRAGGVVLFARLAGHVRGGGGVAAVGHSRIHWHVVAGVFHQRGHAAEPVAGHRHSGGRCHRRNREHRAPPAHGQNALPGGHGSGRRNWSGRDCHHLHADCGVFAHGVHGGYSGQVLQTVWVDGGTGCVRVIGGGARPHAHDGGVPAQAHCGAG
jgi:multidrug efflux pump subunit AcrB